MGILLWFVAIIELYPDIRCVDWKFDQQVSVFMKSNCIHEGLCAFDKLKKSLIQKFCFWCSNCFLKSRQTRWCQVLSSKSRELKKQAYLFCSFEKVLFLSSKSWDCSTRSCLFFPLQIQVHPHKNQIVVIVFSTLCFLLTFCFLILLNLRFW